MSDAPSTSPPGDAPAPEGDPFEDEYGLVVTALLPNLFRLYERICKRIATPDVHNLAYFASTAFCGPVGVYVWEARRGWISKHATLGRLKWFVVVLAIAGSIGAGNPGPLILLAPVAAFVWTGRFGEWSRRLVIGLLAWVILAGGVVVFAVAGWAVALITLVASRPLRWLFKFWRLTRTRPDPDIPPKLTFEFQTLDIVSLVFIGFVFLVMVANRDDLLRWDQVGGSDPAYHMAVSRQILEGPRRFPGRIPLWDRWEYAPFGRPHLYPPGLHVLIAFFSGGPEDVAFGFNTIQILLYPMALLCGWYFARWLFGAAAGFASLIFLSMDTGFLLTQAMVLPSQVVTALIPLILMAFLARRAKTTILLLTIALYTHGPVGVPEFVVLGLLVFCMRYRSYFPLFRKVVAFSFFLYLPWLIHVLRFHEWLGTSSGAMGARTAGEVIGKGIIQLQIINPVLLIIALLGWRREKDDRAGVVKALLTGFLPMLLTYGGRYFMHTWPLWAILAGRYVHGWLERAMGAPANELTARRPSLSKRVTALLLFAVLPLPVLATGMGSGFGVIPGPTAANAAAFVAVKRTQRDRDFDEMAAFIRDAVDPARHRFGYRPPHARGEGRNRYEHYLRSPEYAALKTRIVHIGFGDDWRHRKWGKIYFGNRIVVATGCRTDTGGWGPEVRSELMREEVEKAREADPRCLFAFDRGGGEFTHEEIEKVKRHHRLDWTRRFGKRYLVGGRGLGGSLETF